MIDNARTIATSGCPTKLPFVAIRETTHGYEIEVVCLLHGARSRTAMTVKGLGELLHVGHAITDVLVHIRD